MYRTAEFMWMYTEHPVHAGAGTGVGAIDLPIQREAVTGWPIIQASGIKGALREHFESHESCIRAGIITGQSIQPQINEAFGDESADHAGALAFADAKVLLFPVRSLRGTFAYVTCPLALQRLERELNIISQAGGPNLVGQNANFFNLTGNQVPGDNQIWVAANNQGGNNQNQPDSELTIQVGNGYQVGLEELSFAATPKQAVNQLGAWLDANAASLPWLKNNALHRRLAVVSDNQFTDFVELCTEVVTRNHIDDNTKTVKQGQLWTEEHLPRETVLYAAVFASDPFVPSASRTCADAAAVMNFLTAHANRPEYLWIGGDVTVGRGLTRLAFCSLQNQQQEE